MKSIFNVAILLLLYIPDLVASDNYPVNSFIDVTHYQFSVYLSDSYDLIRGEAVISISHKGKSDAIELDLASLDENGKGMIVEAVLIDDKQVKWTHNKSRLIITLNDNKIEGETSRVLITYSGTPADGMIISTNRFGDRTFFADNWPDRARNWIPCVDHPSDKATVDFIVYSPSHYSVVSNGYLYEESLVEGDIKITHWKEETSISTKVMVIGVARFSKQLAGKVGGTEIWSWVFPEDRKNGFLDYSAAIEPFTFYSEKIGPYAYEKLANVQSKTIFGGMENAGCVFYSERSVTGKNEAERLIAHELAHQWFGNSVTERDWHHIWLSEGFATYFTAYFLESKYGSTRMKADMLKSRTRVIRAYKEAPAPLIDTTITNFMDLLNANSYQKGAWVLHMLRNELGERVFMSGIRTYFSRYRNRTALTSDFISVIEEVSGEDFSEFFKQWLYRPGMPELSITWTYDGRRGEVTLLVEQIQPEDPFDFPLEMEFLSGNGSTRETVRVNQRSHTFTFKCDSKIDSINPDPDIRLLFMN